MTEPVLKAKPRRTAPKLVGQVRNLIHQRDGVLTHDLVRAPGEFGLGQVPAKLKPDATTTMTCGFCSTGCGLNIHLRDGQAVNLSPATEYPVNLGMACPKGWEALNVLDAPDRATTPLLRGADGRLSPTSWDTAMSTFCDRMQAIQRQHGPESVAFLSTGQMPTEEQALLGALAKFGMGMVHGDGNTRQCMATAATAYKQSFGYDAPPFTYQDFEESDVIVLVGSNLCIAHPIMWERVLRNRNRPKIIVIDPRSTETAMAASKHLPLKPKGDLALFYAIAHVLARQGWIDRDFLDAHTTGYDGFAQHLQAYAPNAVAARTGIAPALVEEVADVIHRGERVSFWWTMGVNQSYEGTRVAQSLINLALMTGNIGRPGTGANSITGQANAMGSRLFSNTTCLYGGRDFENRADREHVAGVLGIDGARIPTQNSLPYHQILERVRAGKIRGLWFICTNPAHSWSQQADARALLKSLDFLAVQDMYHSADTAALADLVLPAAGWGEKEGTFINSERRLGVIKKVKQAPGEALSDFSIFRLIADRWGCGEMLSEWSSPEAAFEILKRLSVGTPCDFSGIENYLHLDRNGGIQWPCPAPAEGVAGQRRLFEDGRFYHADGRARFLFDPPTDMPEPPDRDYPYLLLTGRGTASQWHTQTRTSKSAVLRKLYPAGVYVEVNPGDARREGVRPQQRVWVASRRGRVAATAYVTPTIRPGQLFMPMHYPETNRLTLSHFDPHSHQPSYKDCAVRIEAIRGAEQRSPQKTATEAPSVSRSTYGD
ncbi:Nitrate reductase [Pirellulimonas nuda]|uniref:Nitrate reductase n=1 Tax=Pirellulimonas nuda TaxID=2528009 RepID=A0A518DG49_9BACT|nr:nitrate reductase [Pirellulimonas nuda]QDU90454.1 Nitrate reductase [Pirellulimonas nuda]